MAQRRLAREWRDCLLNSSDYFSLRPKDDSLMVWEGNIHNLPDARHLGRNYSLEITFSENYPFRPPIMKFIDKVKCENILKTGYVCMDILYHEWSPAFTVFKLMYCVTSLLTDAPVTGLKNKPTNTFLEELRQKRIEKQHAGGLNCPIEVNRTIPENMIVNSREDLVPVAVAVASPEPEPVAAKKRKRRTELEMLSL